MMEFKMKKFKITSLRQEKMATGIEAITILFFSTFVALFLPQLLFQYVYAGQALTQPPALLQYIPLAAFIIGTAYVLYAIVSNVQRGMMIKKLEKEMMGMSMGSDACCEGCGDGVCNCGSHGECDCGMCEDKMSSDKKSNPKKKTAVEM